MSSNDEISTSLYLPFWREKSHWKVHWNVMVLVMVIVIVMVMVMVMAMDRKNQRRCRIWNPSSKLFRRQKVGMIERTLSRIIGLSIYFIPSSLRQHSVIPSSLHPFILSSLHPLSVGKAVIISLLKFLTTTTILLQYVPLIPCIPITLGNFLKYTVFPGPSRCGRVWSGFSTVCNIIFSIYFKLEDK